MSKQAQRSGLGRSLEHAILVCGTCLRQFSEIKPFILHKTHHVQGGSVYSCELCARAFSSHTVLLYHYQTLHQLQTWDPSTWGSTAASPASPAGPEIPDTEPADPGMDIRFILTTETVKGRAFDYGRMVLQCLHCTQKYYSKEGLVGHVHAMHPGTEGLLLPRWRCRGWRES
ncbi:zinc finger protein 865-like isoform X1 [Malaclemys terrapin pileata]|uniref:zinc finger protein 865-like isoform X1 n=1 Tax=Malaclemys terrapin pileata TaxID=2991368 RepID=UPI0023A87DC4|nr:zinc finger protein 865-like isoform X1 [Malaclemys terrapin pileata]